MIHEGIKPSTALLHHKPVHAQIYADNSLGRCDAVREDGHKFGECLSCGRFRSFNLCKFHKSECLKCGDIEHIHSFCNTTVHVAAKNIRSCYSISNQSTYQISRVIAPDMVFQNDSLISDEIPCKSDENMLNEPSHDRKPDVVLIDADPFYCNDTLNKFEEPISE
ncbi:unnamed protein product [Schistosoma curassoni]|uniref:Phorbol-ester/DAG-type domain-containing protein n=1 Tax=Schistosoma curassoni TaxID=6186 RepID=A0A183KGT2_9TREM|nr:unnamed protein product [Schistosoma curassoni]